MKQCHVMMTPLRVSRSGVQLSKTPLEGRGAESLRQNPAPRGWSRVGRFILDRRPPGAEAEPPHRPPHVPVGALRSAHGHEPASPEPLGDGRYHGRYSRYIVASSTLLLDHVYTSMSVP